MRLLRPVALHGFEAVVWQCKSSKHVKLTVLMPNNPQTKTLLQLDEKARLTFSASNGKALVVWVHWDKPDKDGASQRMMLYQFDAASAAKLQEKDMGRALHVGGIKNGATALYFPATNRVFVYFRYTMMNKHQACTLWSVNPDNIEDTGPVGAYMSHCFDAAMTDFGGGVAMFKT